MSDGAELPTPAATPKKSIWARYRDAAIWLKVAIPIAVLIILIGVGAIIADAVGSDSTSTGSTTTTIPGNSNTLLLVATATQLASDQTTTSTIATTTIPTLPTTALPDSTTAAPAPTTTVAPTTAPPTNPATTPTVPPTEPATTTTSTTAASPTSTAATSTTTSSASTTTTVASTTTTSAVPLPPGQVASSPDTFKEAWNAAAAPSGVTPISTWTQKPLAGHTGSVADLGGNIRLVLLSDGDDSPVAAAILAWLPLTNPSEQPQQNEAYQEAFAVLMKTVNSTVTAQEQETVAGALGLSDTTPPFDEGTSAATTLEAQQYQLRALTPPGQSGVYTLAGVSASP